MLYVVKREPLKNELAILIENPEDTDPDDRQTYTITNNTGKQVNGYYALLSYWPKTSWYPTVTVEKEGWYGTSPEHEYFRGQLMSFDVNLAPGKSMTGKCYSTATGWSTMSHVWITFDDAAERDAFLKNDALGSQQFGYYYDNAVIENFFGLLKSELFYLQKFDSIEHFRAELIDYLDFYNNRRIKAKLKGLPPAIHRQQALLAA